MVVGKVSRRVSLVRYPEPNELLQTMKARTQQKLVGAVTNSSGKYSNPTQSSRHKSGQSRSTKQKSVFSSFTETPKSSKRKHSESSSGKHRSSTSTVSGSSERSGKSKKKMKKTKKEEWISLIFGLCKKCFWRLKCWISIMQTINSQFCIRILKLYRLILYMLYKRTSLLATLEQGKSSTQLFILARYKRIETTAMVCCSFVFKHLWLELLQSLVMLASIVVEFELSLSREHGFLSSLLREQHSQCGASRAISSLQTVPRQSQPQNSRHSWKKGRLIRLRCQKMKIEWMEVIGSVIIRLYPPDVSMTSWFYK